jgi:replicative DNA helicase
MTEKGLPQNVDAERFVLGSIQLNGDLFGDAAAALSADSFSLEKHRRIFKRMGDLNSRGEKIDRVTLANELMNHGELASVDGLTYLSTLDDGLPPVSHIDGYIRIVREKSILRKTIFAAQHVMNRCMNGEDSSEDILAGANQELLHIGDGNTNGDGPRTPLQILQAYEGGISSFLDPSKNAKGLSTGFVKYDDMTGGMHESDLIILAGRPSMGKTSLGLNIAQHVALKLHEPVAIFSLEMSKESLLVRMLCAAARVDSWKFRMGYVNQHEREKLNHALHELTEAPLYIDDTAGLSMMQLSAKLRRLKAEHGCKVGIVDYLQLMSGHGKYENRNQEVSGLSRGMKLLAKDLKIPLLVLSQLSRAVENRTGDHRPQLSAPRGSGSIEQDADLVGFIYREEVYKRDREDLHGLAELIIAKQRSGPIGIANLVFLHSQTKFENRAEDCGDLAEGAEA